MSDNYNPYDDDELERCGATRRQGGGPCQHPAGWGTHKEGGRCKYHGGCSDGAPPGHANALKHGAYADPKNLYRNLDKPDRDWCDALFEAYVETAPFPREDPRAERLRMAVVMVWQEWSAREVLREEGLQRDTTVGVNSKGEPVIDTREHHLVRTASNLGSDARLLLKDLGVLDTDERAASALGESLVRAMRDREER